MSEYYYISKKDLDILRDISKRLHSGSDRERDEGHVLWLIVSEAETAPVKDDRDNCNWT